MASPAFTVVSQGLTAPILHTNPRYREARYAVELAVAGGPRIFATTRRRQNPGSVGPQLRPTRVSISYALDPAAPGPVWMPDEVAASGPLIRANGKEGVRKEHFVYTFVGEGKPHGLPAWMEEPVRRYLPTAQPDQPVIRTLDLEDFHAAGAGAVQEAYWLGACCTVTDEHATPMAVVLPWAEYQRLSAAAGE